MAVYDHQEREQIEDIKAWWAEWGAYVTAAVVVAVLILAGTTAWRQWQAQRNDAASVLYFDVADATETQNMQRAADAVTNLVGAYSGTGYAPRAALLYARLLWDADKQDEAQAQLKWVIDNAKESELKDIATFRLAQTEVDREHFDAALKLLAAKHHSAFTPLFADLQGDALLAQGRIEDAVAAYTTAVNAYGQNIGGSRFYAILQTKLDSAQSRLPNAGSAKTDAKADTKTDAPAAP